MSARIQLFYNNDNCNTAVLLRIEHRTPSYLVFWNFTKYLSEVFETPMNDYIWLAERGIISKEGGNNK